MNKIVNYQKEAERPISEFKGGTLVSYGGAVYVVLRFKDNASNIGAVSLIDGEYLMGSTRVMALAEGASLALVAGKVELCKN